MRTPVAVVVLFLPCLSLSAQDKQRLTFEDTHKQIKWSDHAPAAVWAFDGKHVELIDGKARVWIDPATGARSEPQKAPEPSADSESQMHHVAMRDGKLMLLDGGGRSIGRGRRDRRSAGTDNGDGTVLVELKGKVREAHLAPGEGHASFVRDGNLVVFDLASSQEWAVTQDGGPKLFHGFLDWVYQEEVYGRGNFQGHWWSGKGDQLAFLSLDEAAVKDFTIVNHVPSGYLDQERAVLTEVTSYPKVGDPNPTARVSVARLGDRKVVPVDLSGYPKDVIVARVEWTPDSDLLLLTLQDRIQTTADLFAVDPRTGKGEVWIHEQSSTWVNRPEGPQWQKDGSFLWLSERTGYQHVYHYARGGHLVAAITAGDWQVRSIERVDAQKG
ncbi:MAG TPA: DPP IV N-terminal domain-containing protein, partial [Planctomycetota bacterium]|nr:DPP IV N-terminal domain-containing protein [Planctomycetota bacterium]